MEIEIAILALDDFPTHVSQTIHGMLERVCGHTLPANPKDGWVVPLFADLVVRVLLEFDSEPERVLPRLIDPATAARYDLVLLDNQWFQQTRYGLDCLAKASAARASLPTVAIFTQGSVPPHDVPGWILEAISYGACGFVQKDNLVHLLNLIVIAAKQRQSVAKLESDLANELTDADSRLGTRSPAMGKCLAQTAAYAGRRTMPIMLLGETGTGKEPGPARTLGGFGGIGRLRSGC